MKLYFSPRKAIPYNLYLPLKVIMDDRENLIGQLQLTGVGTSQVFKASVSEVCFPIVPVGTKILKEISIINIGCIQAVLRIQLPVKEGTFPVNITFPQGNRLMHTTQKIPLLLTFQSNRPISFSTLVAVLDDSGHATSFIVTCTADNSVFTLYPYLSNKSQIKDDKLTKEFMDGSELTARFAGSTDYSGLEGNWSPSFPSIMIGFFQRYMNASMLKNPLGDFPGDFVRAQGQQIIDIVNSILGAKQNGNSRAVSARGGARSEDPTTRRQGSIKKMLHTLQSVGALVSEVKPEYLLSRSDFMQIMRNKVSKQILGLDYFNAPNVDSFDQKMYSEYTSSKIFSNLTVDRLKVIEGLYDALSAESWMMIVAQVFKLFVMARVDIDHMNAVPGVTDALRRMK